MSKLSLIACFVLLCPCLAAGAAGGQREIPAAASAIAEELAGTSKRAVAVVDFTDLQGNVTELGRFVAEEIGLGLVTARKGFTLVDRTHLKALMQENKLGASGAIDPSTAKQLGRIAGVDALVTGTITPFADTVRVVVKVLDVETARVLAATSLEITKSKTIEELINRDVRGAEQVVGRSAATPRGDAAGGSGTGPVFQNDRLRATVGQLAVTPNNSRVAVSLTIENTSREPIMLGIEGDYANARVSLSDDRASQWLCFSNEVRGLHVVSQMNDLSRVKLDDLTALGPSERLTVAIRCQQAGVATPGTLFAIAINGLYSTGAGVRRVSIGMTGIRPVALP